MLLKLPVNSPTHFISRCSVEYRVVFYAVNRIKLSKVQLDHEPSIIVEQYHRHGTSEQYHSEIKTDMGLERFPSGKFATNQLVLHCALLAYNCLRLIGQTANESSAIPLRKTVQRRRLKTVIQNLIHMASRLIYHARRYKLSFSKWSPWFGSFRYVYRKLQC